MMKEEYELSMQLRSHEFKVFIFVPVTKSPIQSLPAFKGDIILWVLLSQKKSFGILSSDKVQNATSLGFSRRKENLQN